MAKKERTLGNQGDSCDRCEFWDGTSGEILPDHWKECHRRAPTRGPHGDYQFPATPPKQWCGDFVPKKGPRRSDG